MSCSAMNPYHVLLLRLLIDNRQYVFLLARPGCFRHWVLLACTQLLAMIRLTAPIGKQSLRPPHHPHRWQPVLPLLGVVALHPTT